MNGLRNVHQYDNVRVEVVATDASLTFFDAQATAEAGSRVWTDKDEWKACSNTGTQRVCGY